MLMMAIRQKGFADLFGNSIYQENNRIIGYSHKTIYIKKGQ